MQQARTEFEPYLAQLVPKLFRYRYDPDFKVQHSMRTIWQTLTSTKKNVVSSSLNFFLTLYALFYFWSSLNYLHHAVTLLFWIENWGNQNFWLYIFPLICFNANTAWGMLPDREEILSVETNKNYLHIYLFTHSKARWKILCAFQYFPTEKFLGGVTRIWK